MWTPDRRRRKERTLRFRPDGWGLDMTLCIAAISDRDKCVVGVSDFKLSDDNMASENLLFGKYEIFPPDHRWLMLFAGEPSVRMEVIRQMFPRNKDAAAYDMKELVAAFEAACDRVLERRINRRILSRYGFDRARFAKEGRRLLGEKVFGRLAKRIGKTTLETHFLVAGFEQSGRPRLFWVDHLGTAGLIEQQGMHAIGSGVDTALAILCNTYKPDLSMPELAYRLCEAKFLSTAPSVGEKTIVTVLDWDGKYSTDRSLPTPHVLMMGSRGTAEMHSLWHRAWSPMPPEVIGSAGLVTRLTQRKWTWH